MSPIFIAQLIKQRPAQSLVARWRELLPNLLEDERGQGLTEYALIMALIAVVAIAALAFFGSAVTTELSGVASSV